LVLGNSCPRVAPGVGRVSSKKSRKAGVLAGPESADATRERRPCRARRRASVRSRSPDAGSGVWRARRAPAGVDTVARIAGMIISLGNNVPRQRE